MAWFGVLPKKIHQLVRFSRMNPINTVVVNNSSYSINRRPSTSSVSRKEEKKKEKVKDQKQKKKSEKETRKEKRGAKAKSQRKRERVSYGGDPKKAQGQLRQRSLQRSGRACELR